jgi:MinD-like ATPase involved in chromosome partitioning or flagellar assembly
VDLPTFTAIWRIEKRLYKLYDLRLPMPLPIVWIGVFVGVLVPWSILLTLIGIHFEPPWHVLFLVPPGIVTWLSTRPVIESKRLNELLQSHFRYLGEPKTWCRLAPIDEPDEITFTARVWRTAPQAASLMAVGTVKSASKARRGARAKPKHTAPRRRAIPAWSPARQLPSVKPSSRRGAAVPGAVVPGEVRPAVAAAAAAVTALPMAEPPVRATERPRVTWGSVVAEPGAGAAAARPPVSEPVVYKLPAGGSRVLLPPSASGVSAKPPAASPPSAFGLSATPPPPSPRAVSGLSATPPPASSSPASGVSATPPPPSPRAASGLSATPPPASPPAASGVSATPPAASPSVPAPASRSSEEPVAPIGTEALRRLRRLAASAESRAAATGRPPEREHARLTEAGEQETRGQEAERRESSQLEAAADAWAGGEPDVREQHRKGQPPRPAHTRLPEARTVWPAPRARVPESSTGSGPAAPKPAAPRSPMRPAAREQAPPPLSIRAVPSASGTAADPAAPSVPVPVPRTGEEPRVRRVESVVGRDQSGGWRRLAQVVVGGGGPSRNDGVEIDEARARTVLTGSRRIVVLGCTGGAGQTTTALMLGHTLARYRDDRVLAVDANIGDHTLTSRIPADSPETLTSLLAGLDGVSGYLSMRAYTTRCESGLEVVGSDSDAVAARRLADRGLFSDERLAQAMRVLDRHYRLILVDPAAAVAARMLPYADQLILVAPASEDAPDAVAMTFDWLDGHGSTELRRRAIMVINGVSRRSMGGVEQAEAVARGRCRAIVRVPWEDELAPGHPGPAQPAHLRAGGRRAYVALAGVVASGLAAASRPSEEEVAQ